MGAPSLGEGPRVPPRGGLRAAPAGAGRDAARPRRRAPPAAAKRGHGGREGRHGSAAPGRGRPLSSPAAGDRGTPADPAARRPHSPVLCPGGQGPPAGGSGGGGQPAGGVRWPPSLGQAGAPAPSGADAPDRRQGTVVWAVARAGGPPAAPPPGSVLAPSSPPGAGLAPGASLQLCAAAPAPAVRAHPAPPGEGPWADRPCLELAGVYWAAGACGPRPHPAEGRTDGTSADPGAPGAIS
jgi:hypothetical protein